CRLRLVYFFFFFFSSRRRHTRFSRDWSSDVCSSDLAERPSVLQLMMTAWNKAIRRDFLVDLGLRFSSGYYEDLNVTYPILMAADRLSLLDRVCYVYRQRRTGAITKTAGAKHFDVFAQYDRVFAFMDEMGPK